MKPFHETHPSFKVTSIKWSVDSNNVVTIVDTETGLNVPNGFPCVAIMDVQKHTVDKQRLLDLLDHIGDYLWYGSPGGVDCERTVRLIKKALELEEQ